MGAKDSKEASATPTFKATATDQSAQKNAEVGKKLKVVPILSNYSDDELATLGAALVCKKYSAGEALVKQGDAGNGFYIIETGEAVVTREEDGKSSEIGRLKDGDYFGELALLENKARGATVTCATELTAFFLQRSEFQKLFNPEGGQLNVKFAKRAAVTAGKRAAKAAVIPDGAVTDKDVDTTKLILDGIKSNLLFSGQTEETTQKVVAQMYRQEVKSGETLIKQGDNGEHFYVVQSGDFVIDVDGKQVAERAAGSSFGELALMYNAPRAATVRASSDGVVWVVNREAFQTTVKEHSAAELDEYVAFLKSVQLLAPLTSYEREHLAEAMELVAFDDGHTIFKQGDEGDLMYIVRSGSVVVEKDGAEVSRCKKGDYFGERALLKNDKRAATVKTAEACKCLQVNRAAFDQLLGPLEDILQQQADSYDEAKAAEAKKATEATSDIKFDDLAIMGTLGKGSFGHVQLVQDKGSKKTFALKAVSKAMIVETGQQGHIMSEKNVMMQLRHPFLIHLHQTFKDKDRLYFLLEPVLGGELFTILRAQTLFDENTARFYAGCVVSAFEHMHSHDIIYRDLKPENLLVDHEGYVKITDFGFAKKITGRTWTLCGTPDYLAPEIVQGKGHGKGVDWWTLGVLIYEMLASYPPFYDADPMKTYSKICLGEIAYPSHFSKHAVALIKKLLNRKSTKRLGVVKGGAKMIRANPWFAPLDFDQLVARKLTAPMIPTIRSPTDLSNFDLMGDDESDPVMPYEDDGSNWEADF